MSDGLLEKLRIGRLLTVGGLVIAPVGWGITEWKDNALDYLLEPLGAVLLYGGLIALLAGLVWFAMLYYRRLSEGTVPKR